MRKKKKARTFANTKPVAKKKKKKKAIRATKSAATRANFTLNVSVAQKNALAALAKVRGLPSWKAMANSILAEPV